jgi:hypothetical protein
VVRFFTDVGDAVDAHVSPLQQADRVFASDDERMLKLTRF